MKSSVIITLIVFGMLGFSSQAQQPNDKIQIMLVGYAHWGQLDDGSEQASMFSPAKQESIEQLTSSIQNFDPEMIMVELAPEQQKWCDSLFNLYKKDKLKLEDFEYGSGETYQVGFRLGKALKLQHIYGIDFDNSTSQSLLKSGAHYEKFEEQLKLLQQKARPMGKLVQQDSLSLYDFTREINKPEMLELTHRLIFNLPAYVQNGEWDENGIGYHQLDQTEKQYAGAEYISLFYNRNLKIYSNILNTQLETGARRIYLQMGQAHIGVLKDLLENNPNYEIIDPLTYIN